MRGPRVYASCVLDDRHIIVPIQDQTTLRWALAIVDCYRSPGVAQPTDSIQCDASLILEMSVAFNSGPASATEFVFDVDNCQHPMHIPPELQIAPFYADNTDRVLRISLLHYKYDMENPEAKEYFFAVPVSIITSRLSEVASSPLQTPAQRTIPWEKWGKQTRYFERRSGLPSDYFNASQSRLWAIEDQGSCSALALYDFGAPASMARDAALETKSNTSEIVFEPTPFSDAQSVVYTSAPYRRIVTDITFPTPGIFDKPISVGDHCIIQESFDTYT